MSIQLRTYQQEAIDSIYTWFRCETGNPLVVLPTGTGKSLVLSGFMQRAINDYPETRILMLTHVQELIEQNARAVQKLWPDAPIGIYSAGLNARDTAEQIIFGGIQSVFRAIDRLGAFDLVVVDEAHMIPRKSSTMYGKTLKALQATNPHLKVIGLTATPYRLDSGMLYDGADALFSGVCYDAAVLSLIQQGYLSDIVPKQTEKQMDVNGIHRRGGDFIDAELQERFNVDDFNQPVIEEIIEQGADRKSWLIFCTGVAHAQEIAAELRKRGISADCIVGETDKNLRRKILQSYKDGNIRALTNANVLTTGFDHPELDLIAMLRPTESTSLYVQMVGRGMRIAEGKENCLLLDFAGNTKRHGPIDAVNPKGGRLGEGEGVAPVRTCPECLTIQHAAKSVCESCGFVFPKPEPKIEQTAATDAVLSYQVKPLRREVDNLLVSRHQKAGKPDSLKVTYYCGLMSFSEWICLEHDGYAGDKAERWWRKRVGSLPPETVDEALDRQDEIRKPDAIFVKPQGRYHEITGYE